MAQVLRSERIEHLIGVPSALRLALGRLAGELPYLRTVVSDGSKLSAAETAIIRRRAPVLAQADYPAAVVPGIPDEHRGSFFAAVIEAPPETDVDAVQLRSRLKELHRLVARCARLLLPRTVCAGRLWRSRRRRGG